jgi:hypothetical protein
MKGGLNLLESQHIEKGQQYEHLKVTTKVFHSIFFQTTNIESSTGGPIKTTLIGQVIL